MAGQPDPEVQSDEFGQAIRAIVGLCAGEFNTQFSEIRDELKRSEQLLLDAIGRIMPCFSNINNLTRAQQEFVALLFRSGSNDIEKNAVDIRSIAAVLGGALASDLPSTPAELNRLIAERTAGEVNQAVSALQFQDIITQLLGHVNIRIEVMESALHLVNEWVLAETNAKEHGTEMARMLHSRVADALEHIKANTAKNRVLQEDMGTGDIELF